LYSLTGEKFKELLEDCYPAFQEYAQAQYEQETLKRQASSQLVSSEAVREEPTADYGEIMNLLVQVPVINMLDEDALQQLTRAFKKEKRLVSEKRTELLISDTAVFCTGTMHNGEMAKFSFLCLPGFELTRVSGFSDTVFSSSVKSPSSLRAFAP
ncbi:hypothetical protein TGDOM2_397880, partial [Toxoplasma gondii GAB2-2007-GAL-DOM2]